ncbi:MAG: tetratricopeptide repeat protein [Thermodesulfobacteriota bacterium]
MTRKPRYGVLALVLFLLASVPVTEAWAHRRPQPKPAAKPASPGEVKTPDPAIAPLGPAALPEVLSPEFFLSQAQEQEKTGDRTGSLQTLTVFINLYPQHPERSAALLRAARLAQRDGRLAQARETYALAAALYPDTAVASRSHLELAVLEFYERLGEMEPVPAFKGFLEKIAGWPASPPADSLKEPLQTGWSAVEGQVRAQRPCPPQLVEEVLALWELQPPGASPPEAALLVADLCREKGLWQKAEALLEELKAKGSGPLSRQADRGLKELAGASSGVIKTSGPAPLNPAPGATLTPAAAGGVSLPNRTAPPNPEVSLDPSLDQSLEDLLQRPLPDTVKERLLRQLAQMHWSRADFTQAEKIYQALLAKAPPGDIAVFYQDRLGLSRLKGQRLESAQEVYQGMERARDHFWQVLARTRLLDLEMARLKAAPSP